MTSKQHSMLVIKLAIDYNNDCSDSYSDEDYEPLEPEDIMCDFMQYICVLTENVEYRDKLQKLIGG